MPSNSALLFVGLLVMAAIVLILYIVPQQLAGKLGAEDLAFLEQREEAAFKGMDSLVDMQTGLPVDIAAITEAGVDLKSPETDYKTSPTNIALLIVTIVAERDQGFITEEEAEAKLEKIVSMLELMEKHEGFFFNWYDLSNLDDHRAPKAGAPTVGPEAQRFVSSVDNGNLTAAMMIAVAAFPETDVAARFQALLDAQDYNFFFRKNPFNSNVRLMNHGFDVNTQSYSPYDYGTFMTEARLLSLIAILKDGVSRDAWDNMSRSPTTCRLKNGRDLVVIASWGGSLFEELFPDLFLDERTNAPNSLGENHRRAVRVQIDNADPRSGLWGWSPSQDVDGNYRVFGVPCLGSGGNYPIGDVSPYSVLLAARYTPKVAIRNLRRMEALNPSIYTKGFGYRDVISKDGERVSPNVLSLDKGMETVALHNLLQELRGEEGISQYFWKYMDSIEKGKEGHSMLRELRPERSSIQVLPLKSSWDLP